MIWDTKKVVALGAAVAALTQIGRFGDAAVWLWNSPTTAYAAKAKAEESKTWIDAYIADQQQQRELDQKLAEQEAVYQQKMLELQQQQVQQQAPNQAAPPPERHWWQDERDGSWWWCEWRCDEDRNWIRAEE